MIDDHRIREAEKNVAAYVRDGWLLVKRADAITNAGFFLKNAETSLITAKTLYDLSCEPSKKSAIGLEEQFESYLWVVVSAYYSMFYASLSLIAHHEMKVGDKIVHKVVADTLISKFLGNKKLAKLLETYDETKDKALQIIGSQEKAHELVESLEYERQKRSQLQYEIGKVAKLNLATTSLERATRYVAEMRGLVKSN